MDEGVTKFDLGWERSGPLPGDVVAPLEAWRARMRARGLIGHDALHDVGYGNLSARVPGWGVIITASQTGHLRRLDGRHYAQVLDHDLEANRVRCRGAAAASSESLTHLALYDLDPAIGAVIHVHCAPLWHALRDVLPTTRPDVPYGTVAMAREFARLFAETDLPTVRVAVMGGHPDGLVAFGKDLDEAGAALLERLDALARGSLGPEEAACLARVALAGITREYPNKPGDVLRGPEDVRSPRAVHPAFHGCFDWHSAVHGHWMLVRLLAQDLLAPPLRAEVVAALDAGLSEKNLAVEAAYFDAEEHQAFERTYGWAWLLRLAQELRTWDHEHARRWARHLEPLESRLVALATAYLPKQVQPIRSGEHADSAFALAFFLDHARAVGDEDFAALCCERARTWYGADRDYPVAYEPSGHDFFSAGLNEADLMRRVLPADEFAAWLQGFLPGLAREDLGPLMQPAQVSDVTDGKLVHLAGLNLTRAWTLGGIATALPEGDPRRAWLEALAAAHGRAGEAYVFSGHYAGEHWLASFAVYLRTAAGG